MIELNIMYDYLIVDGYNVLHYALSKGLLEIKSMEGARRWLLDQLVNYTYHQGIRTLLYFDARDSGTPEGYVEDFGRLRMIFPPAHLSADDAIERVCRELSSQYTVQVATSDGLLQKVVFGEGVYRLSARELIERLASSKRELRENLEDRKKNRLDEELTDSVRDELEKWRRE